MNMVTVIGEGAWGTAMATLLSAQGLGVKLWCYDSNVAQSIRETRVNERYMPGVILDDKIVPTTDLKEALSDVQWVFEAIPVVHLRSILQQARPYISSEHVWVILSKGIEQDTLLLPSQIVEKEIGDCSKVVLSGPSFAKDVVQKQPTAVTIASKEHSILQELQLLLANDYFRPYCSDDVVGVQFGGALKNVLALGVGLLDGSGFTDNTKTFILTRGFHELVTCATAMGAKKETLYGLSGIGDLILTSMGKLSRNLLVGKRLGQGQTLENILEETGYIPEGINTVVSVFQIMQKYNLDLPILKGIYHIVFGEKTVQQFIDEIMNRPLEWEQ